MNSGLFAEGYRTVNMLAWKKKVTKANPKMIATLEKSNSQKNTLPVLLYPSTVNPVSK